MWNGIDNNLLTYVDDTTLYARINSPNDDWLTVGNSLNSDLEKICHWCNTMGMKLNPKKLSSFTVNWLHNLYPPHPSLFVDGELVLEVLSLALLGVNFDQKLIFENHIRSTVSNTAQNVGI